MVIKEQIILLEYFDRQDNISQTQRNQQTRKGTRDNRHINKSIIVKLK